MTLAALAVLTVAVQGQIVPSRDGGIVWHGTLAAGLQEAKRTNRPILLMSAMPACHEISGIW